MSQSRGGSASALGSQLQHMAGSAHEQGRGLSEVLVMAGFEFSSLPTISPSPCPVPSRHSLLERFAKAGDTSALRK